jgi:hypothetical protein
MTEPTGLVEWVTAWHGLEATKEEAGDPPLCHTDEEWRKNWIAYKISKSAKKVKYDKVFETACEDCTLEYQEEQINLKRCYPPKWSVTPMFRPAEVEDAG